MRGQVGEEQGNEKKWSVVASSWTLSCSFVSCKSIMRHSLNMLFTRRFLSANYISNHYKHFLYWNMNSAREKIWVPLKLTIVLTFQ